MVLDGQDGMLSIGGVSAARQKVVNKGKKRYNNPDTVLPVVKREIKRQETRREESLEKLMVIPSSYLKEQTDWKWNNVQGPEGWWQMMMTGVWVGG